LLVGIPVGEGRVVFDLAQSVRGTGSNIKASASDVLPVPL
jgi:hypothetical protein